MHMNRAHPIPRPAAAGLFNLHQVRLDEFHQGVWELAQKVCGGPAPCRHRLVAEARDLLALAQISGRLQVRWIDLAAGLRAKLEMEVPVPCLPDQGGPLQVASRAVLGVMYPQEAVFLPQPGYAFVRILEPRPVWHSNVSTDHNQVLCLGPSLPAGIPLKEIILMTYGALTLQTMQINLLDPAGVLNAAAAVWWQANARRIPLTDEPFIRTEVARVS